MLTTFLEYSTAFLALIKTHSTQDGRLQITYLTAVRFTIITMLIKPVPELPFWRYRLVLRQF
jgi:hypothetical protein